MSSRASPLQKQQQQQQQQPQPQHLTFASPTGMLYSGVSAAPLPPPPAVVSAATVFLTQLCYLAQRSGFRILDKEEWVMASGHRYSPGLAHVDVDWRGLDKDLLKSLVDSQSRSDHPFFDWSTLFGPHALVLHRGVSQEVSRIIFVFALNCLP
jgi:hypothetical protein